MAASVFLNLLFQYCHLGIFPKPHFSYLHTSYPPPSYENQSPQMASRSGLRNHTVTEAEELVSLLASFCSKGHRLLCSRCCVGGRMTRARKEPPSLGYDLLAVSAWFPYTSLEPVENDFHLCHACCRPGLCSQSQLIFQCSLLQRAQLSL